MFSLGPYRFTEQDVERTLRDGFSLFDGLPAFSTASALAAGGDGDPTAVHRARADRAIAELRPTDPNAALVELWSAWHEAADALRSAGAYGGEAGGEVDGLFTGSGGVPKLARPRIDVGWGGADGDRQNDRKNHGRPWQALCLWSREVVDDLAAKGHPIAPGGAGENISVVGLPWERVVPGALLQLGGVRVIVSSYATPCKTIAPNFVDRRFDVVHERHGPISRVYATVLEPGRVEVGDPVLLEPGA